MSRAQELFDRAFKGPRNPRSGAYRQGVLDALRYRAGELSLDEFLCPFLLGTAMADAWFAGTDEGHAIARRAEAEQTTEQGA